MMMRFLLLTFQLLFFQAIIGKLLLSYCSMIEDVLLQCVPICNMGDDQLADRAYDSFKFMIYSF